MAVSLYYAATPQVYTLSLHDALPICRVAARHDCRSAHLSGHLVDYWSGGAANNPPGRSEEHTSELQSRENLVCRLLLEKKKNTTLIGHSCTGRDTIVEGY